MGADQGEIELGSYLDATDAQIIALTRLRRAQLASRRWSEKYGHTIRANPANALHWKLLAAGRRMIRGPNPPHSRYIPVETVEAIFRAQAGACYLCQRVFTDDDWFTQDHVTPRERGGRDEGNILLAHLLCNEVKDKRLPTATELAYLARINGLIAEPQGAETPAQGQG